MLRSMLFLLVVWGLLLIYCSSCSTPQEAIKEPQYNPKCTTLIELRNGTTFEKPEDVENFARAEMGCVRYYGEGSCLTRFIKTGKLSYYAMCQRAKP